MRNVVSHLLEDKMDEAVTHYINTHQPAEPVHVEGNSLALNIQDESSGRVVTVMHSQGFASQMCRQVGDQVGDGHWGEELLDADGKLAAIVAHLAQNSRPNQHKVPSGRSDVDTSVILDAPMRLYNGQSLEQHQDTIVVQVPPLPPLPQLQEMKRCQNADWYNNKPKTTLKDDSPILTEQDAPVMELGPGASPANKHQSKKSLPHKKRLSKKLRRNNGNSTPQQDIVVINCLDEVPQEEILPDNLVTAVQHQEHLPEDTHHIAHEMRPIFICQLCGEFYGDEQLKFYQHLKQHYEPHATIIIENPVPDLGIDKMTNTCIVDNVATLPDSIVELSLENTVPKTMYQTIDKHILYTSSDKTLTYNKVQYSMASMDKEASDPEHTFNNKAFRKQKHCDTQYKDPHPNPNSKLEDMGEFSEPEDLMEGIHVAVDEGGEQFEPTLLPHLTVDSGHVHQDHVRHWCGRGGSCGGAAGGCELCAPAQPPPPPRTVIKDEVLQRIFDAEVPQPESESFPEAMLSEPAPPKDDKKKPAKRFECTECSRVFQHRNSLFYHTLMHSERHQVCKDCGKGFYTASALKIHRRTHNDDRPCKCDECGRDFRQWSDLKYHKASIHSNQKHFKCEFCGKEFARRYSLSVHRRIHTGERNYKCDFCSKTFRASSYRLSHMRTHTGSKPYPCTICDKAFRVAYDLRRHMVIHDKVRLRTSQDQKKAKDTKDKKSAQEQNSNAEIKVEVPSKDASPNTEPEKKTAACTVLKGLLDKKQTKSTKKTPKKGAPNVTVNSNRAEGQFKVNTEYTNNVEVFDTRQADDTKFKVYSADHVIGTSYKKDMYPEHMVRLDNDKLTDERDLAMLRPIFRNQQICDTGESERLVFNRETSTTDGKLQVFTQVEKNKEYSGTVPPNLVSLSDIRDVVRDRTDGLHSEALENGFFERLTALYNIPAV
ncbi:uncharacterized protein [Epargyreus clarus]|uniref:uncharacterized protein n=1 Tax=Epargyreus clarus TaxID=520877 RepID=UPI003C2DC3EA